MWRCVGGQGETNARRWWRRGGRGSKELVSSMYNHPRTSYPLMSPGRDEGEEEVVEE